MATAGTELLDTGRRRVENGDKFHNKQQKPAAPSTVIPSITADSDSSALWSLRELGRGHEYLRPYIFFKRPDVAILCAFSGNTIAYSCSMSATGAPSKALKVRPLAAKHYQLRHLQLVPSP